jgi:hypothetical protein
VALSLSVLELLLPSADPPSPETVAAQIEPFAARVESRSPPRLGPWEQAWRSPEGDGHLLTLRPYRPRETEIRLLLSSMTGAEKRRTRSTRWSLLLTTSLDVSDPLSAYGRQARFASIAAPDAIAVHDVASGRVCPGEHLQALAAWATPPPATELYQIHAVYPPDPGKGWWLHTHGLQRTGLPDVEMLRVPPDLSEAAADVIHAFVRGNLGRDPGLRGEADGLFLGHRVAWIPARRAAASMTTSEIGRLADRFADGGHDGRRIVLVEAPGSDSEWRPPLALLRDFLANRAIARVGEAESDRAARLARERWPVFARLFSEHGRDGGWTFDACLWAPTRSGTREYLWWQVLEVSADRLRCRLITPPLDVDGLAAEAESWRDLDTLADWVVHAPTRSVRPETVRVPA